MPEPQILCRMCDNSVNKAVHGVAAILLVRLVGQPPKIVKNEICPHRCFAFYTRTARVYHAYLATVFNPGAGLHAMCSLAHTYTAHAQAKQTLDPGPVTRLPIV